MVNGQLVKTLYLYDGRDIVAVMNGQGQLLESYTRGVGLAGDIGTIVAVTHHAGSGVTPGTYYVHHNHRGDVIITRSGTTTIGTCEYSAFGNLKSSIGNDLCQFKFSSKELDRATGFYYYGYRFYAPQWQRWMSPDPLWEPGFELRRGNRHGYIRDITREPNLYAFVNGNPVTKQDRLGLAVDCECALRVARAARGPAQAYFSGSGADAACHCYVGCQIAKICNQETATAAGVLYEVGQLVRGNIGQAESRDYMNTRIGAEVCGHAGSCRDCCKRLWDNGELF